MPHFIATVDFRFEAESIEKAGAQLRKLTEAARDVGFADVTGQVMLSQDEGEPSTGWTGYGPPPNPDD